MTPEAKLPRGVFHCGLRPEFVDVIFVRLQRVHVRAQAWRPNLHLHRPRCHSVVGKPGKESRRFHHRHR